ncbi:MAG: thermonuclease family protein [Bdellovibrionales bacterium]|nr:thermonuclease family protein [Bdellovibrionales bacterium]
MRNPIFILPLLLFTTLSCPPQAYCERITAKVIGIVDGDTVSVLIQNHPSKIRLWGIDAPERGQPFSAKAKQALSELCYEQFVTLDIQGKDKYGRLIAIIYDDRDLNINVALVRRGLAWWYKHFAPDVSELKQAESIARDRKLGIWSTQAPPTPPWDWRRSK